MTRTVFYSETNDSSLVMHKLDNGLFRVQLDKNTVDLTKVDLVILAREIEDLKK